MLDTRVVSGSPVLIFEQFTLDLTRNALLRGKDVLRLRPQSFAVLHYLAQAGGRVVSNDEIVAAVWSVPPAQPNDSVTQCIKDIRRAIGDDARWIIQTVSGQGYEFKARVHIVPLRNDPKIDEEAPALAASSEVDAIASATDIPRAAPAGVEASSRWLYRFPLPNTRMAALMAAIVSVILVASLVFVWRTAQAMNGDTLTMMAVPTLAMEPLEAMGDENKSYAGRLGEQISQQLSKSPGGFELNVRAMRPADGATHLAQTRYALRGAVAVTTGGREVVMHLTEVQTKRQIWANSFPAQEDSEIGRIASQIARTAAVHIRLAESKRPMPPRPEASHYALLGRVLLESERGPEKNASAMAAFDKAIALDPRHFYALLGYARTRVAAVGNGWVAPDASATYLADAQRAIDTAIEVNHRNVGVHILRGVIERIKGNSERALASLEHGREFNRDYPLVHAEIGRTKIDLGRSPDALVDIAHALQLNPTDDVGAIWCYWAGIAAAHLKNDKSAIDWLTKALQRNRSYKEPLPWLAIAHMRLGLGPEAKALIDEYQQSNPGFTVAGWLKLHPTSNRDVTRERLAFAKILEGLGVPSK